MKVTIGIEEADNGIIVRWDNNVTTVHTVWQTDDGQQPREDNIRRIGQELGRMIYNEIRNELDATGFTQMVLDLEYLPVPTYRNKEDAE